MTTPLTYVYKRTNRVGFNRAGWINASSAAKIVGRNPRDWVTGYDGMQTIESLSTETGIRFPEGFLERKGIFAKNSSLLRVLTEDKRLVQAVAGDTEKGGGIWLHPALVMPFARWIGVDFAAWCESTVSSLNDEIKGQAEKQALPSTHDAMSSLLSAEQLKQYQLADDVLKECGADDQERRRILAERFGGDSQAAKRYRAADAELNVRGIGISERRQLLARQFRAQTGDQLS